MAEMHPQREPIGLLVKTYPKLSETFILEEILGLERLGQPLRIFALQRPTDAIAHDAVARVRAPVSYLPEGRPAQWLPLFGAHLALLLGAPARYLAALRAACSRRGGVRDFLRAGWLVRKLRASGIGHLHAHFISTPADVAELAGRLGMRFSISAHAKDIYLSPPEALGRKLRAASFTVTCTEYNRQTLARLAPHAQVLRMYHGVDATCFCPPRKRVPQDPPLLLAVGRLRRKKGFDTLIEACRLLAERGFAFRCEIVGYGDQRAALQAQIEQAGLAARIVLAGALPRREVIDRYARASVFVQPSRITEDGDRDGIPNVLLEAMAMELPSVATRVSGIPELIRHRDNGLLIDPERPAQIAAAVSELLASPQTCARLGAAARRSVREAFDNDRNLRLLIGLLERRDECPRDRAAEAAAG